MKLSVQIKTKYELGDVLHMTDISNLDSIFASKVILSKNKLAVQSKSYSDISNESVQSNRSSKQVLATGNVVHDYVPFYWGRKTPMVAALQNKNQDLIFLQFSTDLLEDYECVFCNGNAATSDTVFKEYTGITDLDFLDSKSINTVKYASDVNIRKAKQSELLVHDFVGLGHLKCIICYDGSVKSRIETLKTTHRVKCAVYVNKGAYYF